MGLFRASRGDADVRLIGVEAAGEGIETGRHAAALGAGRPGVLHGQFSYVLDNDDGQISEAHSISAGLDYPGVGPEHAYLRETGRATYVSVTDQEALGAFHELSRLEGIVPALEPAHALAYAKTLSSEMGKDAVIVLSLSGRGDKDMETVQRIEAETSGLP